MDTKDAKGLLLVISDMDPLRLYLKMGRGERPATHK